MSTAARWRWDILTAKLLYELKRRRARYGLVAFCMAGGQGGAAVFERI